MILFMNHFSNLKLKSALTKGRSHMSHKQRLLTKNEKMCAKKDSEKIRLSAELANRHLNSPLEMNCFPYPTYWYEGLVLLLLIALKKESVFYCTLEPHTSMILPIVRLQEMVYRLMSRQNLWCTMTAHAGVSGLY